VKPTLPLLLLAAALSSASPAQSVQPPFNTAYQAVDLGRMPLVFNYGGLAFDPNDPDLLSVSAYGSGRIVSFRVVRDAQGFITGFGSGTVAATVGGNDGGLSSDRAACCSSPGTGPTGSARSGRGAQWPTG